MIKFLFNQFQIFLAQPYFIQDGNRPLDVVKQDTDLIAVLLAASNEDEVRKKVNLASFL